jgi:hypothetical protein
VRNSVFLSFVLSFFVVGEEIDEGEDYDDVNGNFKNSMKKIIKRTDIMSYHEISFVNTG